MNCQNVHVKPCPDRTLNRWPAVENYPEPDRIAYAGDWHGNQHWALNAIHHARTAGAEMILHLGDFGYDFHPLFLRRLTNELACDDMYLFFVDGNHENFERLHRFSLDEDGLRPLTDRIIHLPRGYRWTWHAVRYLALGGAVSVDRKWREEGRSWWPQETMREDDLAAATAGGRADILISHDVPAGFTIPGLAPPGTFPDDAIADAEAHRHRFREVADAVQPVQIWHGHYHFRYSRTVDWGWGDIRIEGLDCDGTKLDRNVVTVEAARKPVR